MVRIRVHPQISIGSGRSWTEETAVLPRNRYECRLLFSTGWETANVRLGNRGAVKSIRRYIKGRKSSWLYASARRMVKAVKEDWEAWKKARAA